MSVSTPPLQACRTCEHGRNLHKSMLPCDTAKPAQAACDIGHKPSYLMPRYEQDDQHGFVRHCADWKCRAEVIDAEEVTG